ncbi:MAG: uroporphyrinogen-III C-methyltransferase [Nitriliruptorales bacterium]
MRGTVYVVGGGPGDPGLITLRAAVLLTTCDVVAYDRLAPPDALRLIPEDAEQLCVGKRSGEAGASRDDVHDLLVARARSGKAVVRLKGGDPFIFGRGGEEVAACRAAGVPVEVVSGVSAAVAVPAAAGIPLTHRAVASGFAVVTGHEDPGKNGGHLDWDALAGFPGTLVFLMPLENIGRIADRLIASGRQPDTPVALVCRGTTSHQETVAGTLATIRGQVKHLQLVPPAVAIVGDVVRLRAAVAWRERLPLLGITVLILRTLARSSALAAQIRALGGEALEAHVMHTRPGDVALLASSLAGPSQVQALVVSSPPAVDALADALAAVGRDARALAGVRLLAVGSGAARAVRARLALRPDDSAPTLRDLATALEPGEGTVLVLAQDGGDDAFTAAVAAKGYVPTVVTAYRTESVERLPDAITERLQRGDIDFVVAASSSSARHFAALAADLPWRSRVVSIGPRTSAACRQAGLDVHVEAAPHDYAGIVEALVTQAALVEAGNVMQGSKASTPLPAVEEGP